MEPGLGLFATQSLTQWQALSAELYLSWWTVGAVYVALQQPCSAAQDVLEFVIFLPRPPEDKVLI